MVADCFAAALPGWFLLELDQAERGVVEDDHDDLQGQPDGRLDLGQRHPQAAVPGERHHRHPRRAQRGGDGGGQRVAHGGEPAGDEQPARLWYLPQRHGDQHVRARIHRGDGLRRGAGPHRGDDLLGGEQPRGGDGRRGEPFGGVQLGRASRIRRPVVAGPVSQYLGQHLRRSGQRYPYRDRAGEVAAVRGVGCLGRARQAPRAGRWLGDQDSLRGVVPRGRNHLGLVHAEPDDEVGRGQQRPLHRAPGDQAGRLGGGVREDAARPVGVQRRDAAARQGRPDGGGPRDGARAQQQHRAPRRPQRPG